MGLIDEHLRTDVTAGDGAPGSGKPGPADDMQNSNLKVNAIGDVLSVGYLAEGAIVPNTPEGRAALAGSTELSTAFAPASGSTAYATASQGAKADQAVPNTTAGRSDLAASSEVTSRIETVAYPRASLVPVAAFSRTVDFIIKGAVPDYTGRMTVAGTGTDNRAAIQAALDAAAQPDGGGRYGSYWYSYQKRRSVKVKLPPGHYLIGPPPTDTASLNVPEHVDFDTSEAVLYYQYPLTATAKWAGAQVYKSGSIQVGTWIPAADSVAPDTKRLYDAIRLVATDNCQGVVTGSRGHSEIAGFQGAGIRLIGAWITTISDINFTSDWGIIFSSMTSGNIYGLTIPDDMPSRLGRGVTDVTINNCYFQTRRGGIVGPIVPDGGGGTTTMGGNNLDYTNGALQLYMNGGGFENFNALPIRVTGYEIVLTNVLWEEVSSGTAMAGWFDAVRQLTIRNMRWNHTGKLVPGPSGDAVSAPPLFLRLDSVEAFKVDGGYVHNTYQDNLPFAKSNAGLFPDSYEVSSIRADAKDFAKDVLYAGTGQVSMSGRWNKGHLVLGGYHIWPDASGVLRVKSSAPTSDTDGTVIGTQS